MSILALALAMAPSYYAAAQPVSVSVGRIIESFRPVAFAAAPTGSKIIASMEDGSVRIIDAKTHQTVRILAKHPQPAYALAWSEDGQLVASGDETARIWIENALTGKKIREYRTHTKGIEKLSFNEFGNLLISTGKDDQVNVYDLKSPKPKEILAILGHGANFYGATFNPHSSRFFTVGMLGGGLRQYDAMTGKVDHFMVDSYGQGIFDVSFNPNGTRELSAGRDGNAILWDATSCKRICALKGHTDWVVSTAIAPNGHIAATSSTDRTVKIWNLYSMQKIADLPGQSAVGSPLCFTADGSTLVSVSDSGFMEFNPVTPAQVAQVAIAKPRKRARRA